MRFSHRMDNLAPYLFAAIEQKIAEKRKSGVDVISLGIGDPDIATPSYIVEEMRRQVADGRNHQYPSNRGLKEYAEAAAAFYQRRFGVMLDPEREFMALLGAKEGLAHICMALLDTGDLALVPDPGYPVYAGGSIMMGAEVKYLRLHPENGFLPDLDEITEDEARRAKVLFISYPNNPTAAVVQDGFFEQVVAFAKKYDIAVVHDNPYSEITYDGYVAPSFLAAPGAKDVGVEFFSFSKPFNMTGWRTGFAVGNHQMLEHLWRLKTNMDSGMFDALQRTSAFVLNSPWDFVREMCEIYRRRRDLLAEALVSVGMEVPKPKATIYMWIPVPSGYTSASFSEHVLEQAGVVVTPGLGYGPAGEGFVRLSLTTPDHRIAEAVERIERSLRL
ncbi:MAG: LL-diaminopimelate aminotransferase [Thermoleophilia bacterium]|nr:LL-diaminopimelate aminotransferase [Thermoleophilia bacterium]